MPGLDRRSVSYFNYRYFLVNASDKCDKKIPSKNSEIFFLGCVCGRDLIGWSERLAVNSEVATVLGSIPASFDTAESEGCQMKQY
jgi:hypothetical protein